MPVRFRFCGDDEVPDWILAAIYEISSIEPTQLKPLVQSVVDAILDTSFTVENDKKLTLPVEFFENKIAISATVFIFQNSISFEVTESTLSNELQQIGLPHEHAITMCRIYTENISRLKYKAKQLSLRCSIPKNIECVLDNSNIVLNMEVWQTESNSKEKYSFVLTKEQLCIMIEEFTAVYERVNTLV